MKPDKEIEQEVNEIFDGMSREEFKQSLIDAGLEVKDSEPGYEGLILFDEQSNIRQWYGVIDEYEDNEINKTIDHLLATYQKGIFKLFPKFSTAKNVIEILDCLSTLYQDRQLKIFIDYLTKTAFSELIKLCRKKLPNDKNLIRRLNLRSTSILNEFDMKYPEELKIELTDTIEFLPVIIDLSLKG
ncbi:MAG: hypothetical protein K0Q49_2474 [Haloplasmataceae bacterium]|jgi:hypothetical protein|nr:hypothetical protein [Haloplasmataceae bacterium]